MSEKDRRNREESDYLDAWGHGYEIVRELSLQRRDLGPLKSPADVAMDLMVGLRKRTDSKRHVKVFMRDFVELVIAMRVTRGVDLPSSVYSHLMSVASNLVGYQGALRLTPGYARGAYEFLVAIAADASGMGSQIEGTQYEAILSSLFERRTGGSNG